ncbi:hypothetical protein HPP92_006949 [Vanilla planifolia]|uniref:SBP-type domain-containing protein n=1 Tax=Vanilla planifolia TaxID=51239 RepID=A0A835V880_VANPL|nr:hypothetical protein HPP92_006949 [Vanilla planifolia]
MDLTPPSPLSPTLPSPPTVVAAADDLSASEIWDWGNLLDFAIEADDSLILPLESLDVAQLPSSMPLASEVESPAEPPAAVGRSSRVRKRDPRLVCANYLAGRVPCSCPEVDEKALEGDEWEVVVGGKKRARAGVVNVGVRCQVMGCEADISDLKGYHRRHRVCLRCANASSVNLDGEEKRYCQQCGKFHALLDFDEGKRSCRRKLERHNKRRRRKPADSNSVAAKENAPEGEAVEDVILCTDQRQEITIGSASKDVDNVANNMVIDGKTFWILMLCISLLAVYCLMCPTGRMSFKLYDWNPAEFPRRLRHQIFQWLSSMPVELEGYIRPGCTILTIFIAMPPDMWDKMGNLTIRQLLRNNLSFIASDQNMGVSMFCIAQIVTVE